MKVKKWIERHMMDIIGIVIVILVVFCIYIFVSYPVVCGE